MADKVSESEDTGTARARADLNSIAQGQRDFGRNNSSVRNALGLRRPTFDPGEPSDIDMLRGEFAGERLKRLYPYGGEDHTPDHTVGDELPGVRHYHRRAKD